MTVAKCGCCGETKDASLFYKNKARRNGLTWCCKDCNNKLGKAYRNEHQEELKDKYHAYRKAHREHARAMTKQWRQDNPALNAYSVRRAHALKRKLLWLLDKAWYLANIWDKQCAYGNHPANGGIDRIDSNKGYEPNNCVPCCFICNMIKGTLTLDEMYAHIENMLACRNRKPADTETPNL